MALVSVLAVLAFGLVVAEDQDTDAAEDYDTGLSWKLGVEVTTVIGAGDTWDGSVPGVTFTKAFQAGSFMIVANGTPTEKGDYYVHTYQSGTLKSTVLISVYESGSGSGSTTTGPYQKSYSWTVGTPVEEFVLGPGYQYDGSVPGITFEVKTHGNTFIHASGTPTKAGTYLVTTYGSSPTDSSAIINTITVSGGSSTTPGTISYTSPSAVDALSGSTVTYKPTVNVSGATFSTTTVTGKTNASWLSFSSGSLSGKAPTVTSETTYYYSIKATSPGGQEAVQTVSFKIFPIAKISDSVKTSYNLTQNTAMADIDLSGNLPMNWSKKGSLPAGLVFSGSKISGTPSEYGDFTITLCGYVDDYGPSQNATKKITFKVAEQTLSITSTAPTGIFYTGKNYSYTPTATIQSGVTWSLSDNPSWLVVYNGVVTGTVPNDATQGKITYTLTATSPNKQVKSQTCSFDVEPLEEFTSVPIASCAVFPVVTYNDDGGFSLGVIVGDFFGSIASFFDVGSADADSAFDVDKQWTVGVEVPDTVMGPGTTWEGSIPGITFEIKTHGNIFVHASGTPTVAGDYTVYTFAPGIDKPQATVNIKVVAADGSQGSGSSGSSGDSGSQGSGSSGSDGSSDTTDDSGKAPVAGDPSVLSSQDTRTFRFVWTGEYATSVSWDFGDGSTATGFEVWHTYSDNGTYKYSCTGHNKHGEDTCTGTVVVDVPLVKHIWNTYMLFIIIGLVLLAFIIVALIVRSRKLHASQAIPFADGRSSRYKGKNNGRNNRNNRKWRNGGRH